MNKGKSKKNQEKLKAALAAMKKEHDTKSSNSKASGNRTGTQAN